MPTRKTNTRTKRPLTPTQLANLAKGNPRVAERHARGEYDERVVAADDATIEPADSDREKLLELLYDYEQGIRERDERIEQLEGQIRFLEQDDLDPALDDPPLGPDADNPPFGHCSTCGQPLQHELDSDEYNGTDGPEPDDDGQTPRRGPLGAFWEGLTAPSPVDNHHPWSAGV